MKKTENEIQVKLLSRSSNESFIRAAVAAFVAQLDPTLEELNDIKTAVSEGVTNCIIHAYPDSVGTILVKVRLLEKNHVEITIKDYGCGIPDVEKAKEPMYTTGGNERSGMGFTIMDSFMDSLRVRSKVGAGTTLFMSKKISVRAGGGRKD